MIEDLRNFVEPSGETTSRNWERSEGVCKGEEEEEEEEGGKWKKSQILIALY